MFNLIFYSIHVRTFSLKILKVSSSIRKIQEVNMEKWECYMMDPLVIFRKLLEDKGCQ